MRSITHCLRITAKMVSKGSKYLIALKIRRIFKRRVTRNTLKVGLRRLTIGKIDNKSIIAIDKTISGIENAEFNLYVETLQGSFTISSRYLALINKYFEDVNIAVLEVDG